MRLLLIWRDQRTAAPAPDVVQRRVLEAFGEIVTEGLTMRLLEAGGAHVLFAELPVKGFRAPFFQEDDEGWALATEYPWQASQLLRAHGIEVSKKRALVALGRLLRERPELVAELAPPFSLVYAPKVDPKRAGADDELSIFTDGLGQAQLEEHDGGALWALSSRMKALEAVGVPMTVVPEDWAVRFTLGWFPLDRTGFDGVRHVGPGERFTVRGGRVTKASTDALASWVHPPRLARDECLELAEASVLSMVDAALELWKRPSVGLSGGWDSRMVASCLLHRGADVDLRVRGNPRRFDVLLATELAEIAGLEIRAKTSSGLPPEDADACRVAIEKALVWQAGGMPTRKHKTFLVRKPRLDGGVVNVMGQHGGLGKADFAVKIDANALAPEQFEDALVDKLMKDCPVFLHEHWKQRVRDIVRASYRQATTQGLEGLHALHYYFLIEYTRRWGSASVNSQTGLVFTPILNPDFARAAYAFPAHELPQKPFHAAITRHLAPQWADVPYESQEARAAEHLKPRLAAVEAQATAEDLDKANWKKHRQWQKYDNSGYWRDVARPLFEKAVASDGLVRELFDEEAARGLAYTKGRHIAEDTVALAYLVRDAFAGTPARP